MAQNGNANNVQPPQVQEDRIQQGRYACMFCPKTFSNSQALGGHQNAHKLERSILSQQGQKMFRRDMNLPGHGGGYPVGNHQYYPYPMPPAPSMVAAPRPPVPYYSVPPHPHYAGVAQGAGYHGIIPRGMMMMGQQQQLPTAAANPVFMPGSSSQVVPNGPAGPGIYPNPVPPQRVGRGDHSDDVGESELDLTLRL